VHPVIVVNEAPLLNILNNPEATGHVDMGTKEEVKPNFRTPPR
jgi:hypothetical protein